MTKLTTVFDTEVYPDYFLASFKETITGKVVEIEAYPGYPLDVERLGRMIRSYRIVTFNGNHFDMPLVALALTGADCARIKKGADAIINRGLKSWQFEDAFGVKIPTIDHIDIFDVAPGMASLKVYAGRLHCAEMQDLPFDPDSSITDEMRAELRRYCRKDLNNTQALFDKLAPQIELRERMTAEYGIDLRSKSDAQIAEAVLAHQVEKITGAKVKRVEIPQGTEYGYKVPDFIQFMTEPLRHTLQMVRDATFVVISGGKIAEPAEFKKATVTIGAGVYRLGIGGLHSSEQNAAHEADESTLLVDRDVASYYPAIILGQGLYPRAMGPAFTSAYRGIVKRRLAAKAAGDKVTSEALKITINGSFGKFGSMWSKLYSPDLLIQTTITGQLALLMLIEALESEGITVVSANTDGIVIKCPRDLVDAMDYLVTDWEQRTGFDTEATEYRAIYSRDVNNYIALKPDGAVKLKGAYASVALAKNPVNEICNEAAVRWLRDGTSVEKTVRECRDIRKFVTIRTVKGGAMKGERYLGKAVRWYYAGVPGTITYKVNGYTVARSEGAQPLMDLPDEFPTDVDFDWYIRETVAILADVGGFNNLA